MNVKQLLHTWSSQGNSPEIFARSCAVGMYIAFSPYLFLHTVMAIVAIWIFRLHGGITFAVACGVNNPWTLIPIYGTDYAVGYWIVHHLLQWNVAPFTPAFFQSWTTWIESHLGIGAPCIWSFFIGGNFLGIVMGITAYYVSKLLFTRSHFTKVSHENSGSE